MRYLGYEGSSRGFRALFNGNVFYCPEKIVPCSDDILIEKSFSQRLTQWLTPYFDGDMRLHQCLPAISHRVGTLAEAGDKCIVFTPNTHALELPFRLIAALLETFSPDLLEGDIHYFASSAAEAAALRAAFPVEKKHIYLPEGVLAPEADGITSYWTLSAMPPKDYIILKDKFSSRLALRLDGLNLFRTLGLSALILHAVFLAGDQKLWFYGDEFNIAVPADNLEMLTAAYYLVQAGLPIRKVLAISSQNRIAYNFLSKGGFSPAAVPCDAAFYAALSRFLYEISKGSMPKVLGWQENMRQKGSFVIDTGSQHILNKKIEAHFAGKNLLETVPPISLSKTAHAAYTLTQDYQIPTIVIEGSAAIEGITNPSPLAMDALMPRLH